MGERGSGKALVMNKRDLGAFMRHLAASYTVLAPIDEGGVTRFAAAGADDIRGSGDLESVPVLSKRPLKEMFFPQEEVLFAFDAGGKVEVAASAAPADEVTQVAFGVRPCDARSLTLLDLVFDADDYKDPYYVSRRRSTRT
ncbi:MAG: hypothetical protein QME92_04200 [Bacillota bacterium]|nr:hypothetical protein [Bacillota bacterium]